MKKGVLVLLTLLSVLAIIVGVRCGNGRLIFWGIVALFVFGGLTLKVLVKPPMLTCSVCGATRPRTSVEMHPVYDGSRKYQCPTCLNVSLETDLRRKLGIRDRRLVGR